MNLYEALKHHTPFLNNKYSKWYFSITSQNSVESYTESHHILPKSLFPEYKKCSWNIVKLSARQHFLAHILLLKIVVSVDAQRKMSWAVQKLKGNNKYFNSRLYEIVKKKLKELGHSEEQKLKISKTKLSQKLKHTEESKKRISEAIKGTVRGPMTIEHKQKMIESKRKSWVPKIWMNKNGIQTKVKHEEIDSFIMNGWKKGTNKNHVTEEYKKLLSRNTKKQWQKVKSTGHTGLLRRI